MFPPLQEILAKYQKDFEGYPIPDSLKLDGEVTGSEKESVFDYRTYEQYCDKISLQML